MIQSANQAARDARARKAAAKAGLRALRSRRPLSARENNGEFALFDASNRIVAGIRFELTPEQVVVFCRNAAAS
jgi:hypothetical protein